MAIREPANYTAPAKPLTLRQIAVFVILIVSLAILIILTVYHLQNKPTLPSAPIDNTASTKLELRQFQSEQEFQQYLAQSQSTRYGSSLDFNARVTLESPELAMDTQVGALANESFLPSQGTPGPDRYSQTNVQVQGIDEPDMVKTNGQQLFLSLPYLYHSLPEPLPIPLEGETSPPGVAEDSIAPSEPTQEMLIAPGAPFPPDDPRPQTAGTGAYQAFPPEQLALLGGIPQQGDLLLFNQQLVVLNSQGVFSYNIGDPAQPAQSWQLNYESNNQLVTARAYNGQLYLVTRTYVSPQTPCPIAPLRIDDQSLTIACSEIYYPNQPISSDSLYTVYLINPQTGNIQNRLSVLGSTGSTIVAMFPDSLYLTYVIHPDMVNLVSQFLSSNPNLFPQSINDQIQALNTYPISDQAKMVELQHLMESYTATLTPDQRRKFETDLENQLEQFLSQRQRQLEQTGITRISLPDLQVMASNQVPGIPLNQFSLDEYQGNLRIATTIGSRNSLGWGWGSPNFESVSDVYVLNSNLEPLGSVQDLGKTERIYAVRFIADMGYVVTFRETDPFYVLDLATPTSPKMVGELKIPGYSSYLHPLTQDLILGIGKEDTQVKLSLFDVSNPQNPTEVAKYTLDEYWSEVLNTHTAFLHDPQTQTFFIPGGQSAYIFNYLPSGELSLTRAVSDVSARRSLFIDNYLYVISDQSIIVLDQTTWEEVNRLTLQ